MRLHTSTVFFAGLCVTVLIHFIVACNSDAEKVPKRLLPYHVIGTLYQDSTRRDSVAYVYVDNHRILQSDTIAIMHGRFEYHGSTADVDELFIYDDDGLYSHLYASADMDMEIEVDSLNNIMFLSTDTLNGWLHEMDEYLTNADRSRRVAVLDSICHSAPRSIGPALLLLQQMPILNDSLLVRRCLGSLEATAKPDWLLAAMERYWASKREHMHKGDRLPYVTLEAADTIIDLTQTSRKNGVLLLLWADYAPSSVDSLRSVLPRVAREYGLYSYSDKFFAAGKRPKRLELVSICLSATDSIHWQENVKGLPGHHVYLSAGVSDPHLDGWNIGTLPMVITVDQFNNVSSSGVWDSDLAAALRRMPNVPITERR